MKVRTTCRIQLTLRILAEAPYIKAMLNIKEHPTRLKNRDIQSHF